jgi:hypothetical protein
LDGLVPLSGEVPLEIGACAVLTDSPIGLLFSALWQMVLILAPLGPLFAQSSATPLGRIGSGFSNTGFSISKNTKISKTIGVQFRFGFFDLFNQASVGQPGNVVGSPVFWPYHQHTVPDR